ncbi:MAG: type I-F CRISPR-associated endoribonuclease Cas6/Csy4 [Methyloprofundus sp.]|nr:type I-F CRISPR-associated endoribonuclease Cas6/Csy4 [Methyloprofundus sp.]
MNHYIDILIKPDEEMRENVLLNKVYAKFHKALFTLQANELAVSFPQYKIILGQLLRIHGTESKLAELQASHWLGGLSGYCDISAIQVVPENVLYRTISRKQANMTEAKLRRLLTRESITQDEIKGYKTKMFAQGLDNPYLELESTSNGHKHRRYIAFGELVKSNIEGKFDSFGLSKTATIPWFE